MNYASVHTYAHVYARTTIAQQDARGATYTRDREQRSGIYALCTFTVHFRGRSISCRGFFTARAHRYEPREFHLYCASLSLAAPRASERAGGFAVLAQLPLISARVSPRALRVYPRVHYLNLPE